MKRVGKRFDLEDITQFGEPSRTLSETQAKACLLLHGLREHQGADEGQDTDDKRLMRVVLREVAALTGEVAAVVPATITAPDLVGLIDLSAATMKEMRAVYEVADELGTAEHAQAWRTGASSAAVIGTSTLPSIWPSGSVPP